MAKEVKKKESNAIAEAVDMDAWGVPTDRDWETR
jgi:hypothetical protein